MSRRGMKDEEEDDALLIPTGVRDLARGIVRALLWVAALIVVLVCFGIGVLVCGAVGAESAGEDRSRCGGCGALVQEHYPWCDPTERDWRRF